MVELLSSDDEEEKPGDEEEEEEEVEDGEEEQDEAEYSEVRRAANNSAYQMRPPITHKAQLCRQRPWDYAVVWQYLVGAASDQAIMQKQTCFGFHSSTSAMQLEVCMCCCFMSPGVVTHFICYLVRLYTK